MTPATTTSKLAYDFKYYLYKLSTSSFKVILTFWIFSCDMTLWSPIKHSLCYVYSGTMTPTSFIERKYSPMKKTLLHLAPKRSNLLPSNWLHIVAWQTFGDKRTSSTEEAAENARIRRTEWQVLGAISATHSSPLHVPPRERASLNSGKAHQKRVTLKVSRLQNDCSKDFQKVPDHLTSD